MKEALGKIFEGIRELHEKFPCRKFTIDGRLVGDLGEVIAQTHYDIKLFEGQEKDYDAECSKGKVQIKATFKDNLTFKKTPEFYLGLKLRNDGEFEEIFNGPGEIIEEKYKHRKNFGEKSIGILIEVLRSLNKEVKDEDRIKRRSN